MLAIVGIGAGGDVSARAQRLVSEADLLVGGRRHLGLVAVQSHQKCVAWDGDMAAGMRRIEVAHGQGQRVVVLASGDPLHYGIGEMLVRRFAEAQVHPHLSASTLARARLGWALRSTHTVSVHGRPLESLVPFLQPGRRLLVLTAGAEAPRKLAAFLTGLGWGGSRLWVLENLGAEDEAVHGCETLACVAERYAPLHVVALELHGPEGHDWQPQGLGLDDEVFEHDGVLTKSPVRSVVLGKLKPVPGRLLWDLGAGSGSVSVSWVRLGGRACAVEQGPRFRFLEHNSLGLEGMTVVQAEAQAWMREQNGEAPGSIYVGGGCSEDVLTLAYERLPAGGRLVACAVTVECEQILHGAHRRWGGSMERISVETLSSLGGYQGYAPARAVVLCSVDKLGGGA